MQVNPNSPLTEWSFTQTEITQLYSILNNPTVKAYLHTQLALMIYEYMNAPSYPPSNGNSLTEQERIDRQMIHGAQDYLAKLYDYLDNASRPSTVTHEEK